MHCIVPTLCVGNAIVRRSASRLRCAADGTQSVRGSIPTQSVGTMRLIDIEIEFAHLEFEIETSQI